MSILSMAGKACTPAERALPDALVHCLTQRQARGVLVDALCGLISFISVLVVFIFIVKNAIRTVRASGDRRLFKMPIELYLVSLFIGDFIHGLGATLKLKWVYDGKVQSGSYCNVQGFAIHVGSTTIAMTTFAIAMHTFVIVWRGITTRSFLFPSLIVGTIWTYTVLFAAVSMIVFNDPSNRFYQPVPYWCWIGNRLPYRVVGQWLWMWLALVFSLLLYFLLFLWIRGNITVKPENPWWKFKMHQRVRVYNQPRMQRYSHIMIVYALIYSTFVLPLSIVRWTKFVLEHRGSVSRMPSDAAFTTISIYNLIGVANVLLFFFTREGLLFFKDRRTQTPIVVSVASSIEFSSQG